MKNDRINYKISVYIHTCFVTSQSGFSFHRYFEFWKKNHRLQTLYFQRTLSPNNSLYGQKNLVRLRGPMADYGQNPEDCHSLIIQKHVLPTSFTLKKSYEVPLTVLETKSWENKSWEWLFPTVLQCMAPLKDKAVLSEARWWWSNLR